MTDLLQFKKIVENPTMNLSARYILCAKITHFLNWSSLFFCACTSIQNLSHVSTLCKLCSSFVINQNLRDLQLGDSNSLSQKPFRISPCSYEYIFLTMTSIVTSQYSDHFSWITLYITSRTTKSVKLLVVVGSVSSCDLVSAFHERKRNTLKRELFWAGILYSQTWNNRVTAASCASMWTLKQLVPIGDNCKQCIERCAAVSSRWLF